MDAGSEGYREQRSPALGMPPLVGEKASQGLPFTPLNLPLGPQPWKGWWERTARGSLPLSLQACFIPSSWGLAFSESPSLRLAHLLHLLAGWLQHLVGPDALGCSHQALLLFVLAHLLVNVSEERLHCGDLGKMGGKGGVRGSGQISASPSILPANIRATLRTSRVWRAVPRLPAPEGAGPASPYHGLQGVPGVGLGAPLKHGLEQQRVLGDALVGLDEQVPQHLPPRALVLLTPLPGKVGGGQGAASCSCSTQGVHSALGQGPLPPNPQTAPLTPARRCGREGYCPAVPGRRPWSVSLAGSTGHRAGSAG